MDLEAWFVFDSMISQTIKSDYENIIKKDIFGIGFWYHHFANFLVSYFCWLAMTLKTYYERKNILVILKRMIDFKKLLNHIICISAMLTIKIHNFIFKRIIDFKIWILLYVFLLCWLWKIHKKEYFWSYLNAWLILNKLLNLIML